MTAVLLNATTFFRFVSLFSSFLFGAWNIFHRGTFSWNNSRIVEQPGPARRGTFAASWNNFVEQFRRRGTIFFQKKGLTLFFSRSNYAPFRGTICAPWNILACQVHFLGEDFL